MKKLVILSLLVVAGAITSVNAQGKFRAGVKGGVNVASLGGDSREGFSGFDTRVAYHIGGFVEVPFGEKISLQPEVLYSAQGSSYGGALGFSSFDDTSLNYVNVPVIGKYYIIKGLAAELGPVFGVLISAKDDDDFDDFEEDEGGVDVDDRYKSIDAGVAVGASYTLDFGLFGSIRYQKGLINVNDFGSRKNQNNVFQVSVGYSFL